MNGTPSTSATDRALNALMDFLNQGAANWVLLAMVAAVLLVLAWFVVPAVFRRVEYGKEKGKQDAAPPKPEASSPAEQPILQLSLDANHLALLPASAREILMAVAVRDVERITAILNRDGDTHAFTEQAVRTFLDTLGEQNIRREDVPTKLAEIANAHLRLLDDLAHVRSSTPEAQKLREQAEAAAQAGRHAEVDALLQQVRDAELSGLDHLQTVLDERKRNASRAEFDRATNAQTQLDHATAAQCYEAAADLLPEADPRPRLLLLDRAAAEWLILGNVTMAASLLERMHLLATVLAGMNPGNLRAQRDLFVSLGRIGDIRLRQGRLDDAYDAFNSARANAQSRLDTDANNAQAQRDLSVGLEGIGDVLLRQERLDDAFNAYDHCRSLRQARAETDSCNTEALRDLSVSLEKIGNIHLRLDRLEDALEAFSRSCAIDRICAEAAPNDALAQRDLSVSLDRIGDVRLKQGLHEEAFVAYDRSHAIAQKLAEADPNDAQAQEDLAVSHHKLSLIPGNDASVHARAILAIVEPMLAAGTQTVNLTGLRDFATTLLADTSQPA